MKIMKGTFIDKCSVINEGRCQSVGVFLVWSNIQMSHKTFDCPGKRKSKNACSEISGKNE